MGYDRALEFLEKHRDIQVILIDRDMKVYASSSIKERISLIEDVKIEWI